MKNCIASMTITVALGTAAFTGCDNSANSGTEFSEKDSAPVHSDKIDAGARSGIEDGMPQEKVESLPKDFALEYVSRTAGVLPSDEKFVRIQPDRSGGFLLTAGVVTYDGGAKNFVASVETRQTEEQCLSLYNEVRKAGFFGLKDNYEEMEFGGIGKTVKITSNGSTKAVHVYGTRVEAFDLVVSAIQALPR